LLIADVITYEPNANWREYRATNHLAGGVNLPAGGNFMRLDGSGQWLAYDSSKWTGIGDNAEARPLESQFNLAYASSWHFRTSGLFWGAPSDQPAQPSRGEAVFYNDLGP
jgi:hypothetical protein